MSKTLTQRLAKFARKHANNDPFKAAEPHAFQIKDALIMLTPDEAEILRGAINENYVLKKKHEAARDATPKGCFCAPFYKDTNRRLAFGDNVRIVHRGGSIEEGRLQAIHFNKGPVIILSFVGCDHERLIRFCEEDGDYAVLIEKKTVHPPNDAQGKPIAVGAFVRENGWEPEDERFDSVGKVVSIDDDEVSVDFAACGEDPCIEVFEASELTQTMRPLDSERKVCELDDIVHNPNEPDFRHFGTVTDIVNHFTVEVTFDDTGATELWHAKHLVHGKPLRTTQDACADGTKVKETDVVWSTLAYASEDARVSGWPAMVLAVYPPNLCKVTWNNPHFPSLYPRNITAEVPVRYLTHLPRAFDVNGAIIDENTRHVWPIDSVDPDETVCVVGVIDAHNIRVASHMPEHNGIKTSSGYTVSLPDSFSYLIENMESISDNTGCNSETRKFATEWASRLKKLNQEAQWKMCQLRSEASDPAEG